MRQLIMMSLLFSFTYLQSCRIQEIPTQLIGKWDKVELGEVLDDGTEYVQPINSKDCPKNYYIFSENHKHYISSYHKEGDTCFANEEEREFFVEGNQIIVNDEKYIYTIKDLQPKYLKLYLHKHDFSEENTERSNKIFVYTLIKSKTN